MDLLLNWLAQGAVVAIAAAAGLRIIPASRAQARYGFLWAGYLLVLALPLVPSMIAAAPIAVPPLDLAPVPGGPVAMPVAWWTSSALALSLWMTWSSLHALRFIVGAVAVRRARRLSEECPRDVLAALPHWSTVRTTGRPTRVVLSDRVRHAAVLGFGSPVIALAPRLLKQLSGPDLDRVLVHEWAHVQRRDDLAQLLQQLVRAIAGWHPAAWWLERRLDFEREVACDEVAVDVTGSAKGYAACLVTLAAMLQDTDPFATGTGSGLSLAASRTSRADSAVAMDRVGSRTSDSHLWRRGHWPPSHWSSATCALCHRCHVRRRRRSPPKRNASRTQPPRCSR